MWQYKLNKTALQLFDEKKKKKVCVYKNKWMYVIEFIIELKNYDYMIYVYVYILLCIIYLFVNEKKSFFMTTLQCATQLVKDIATLLCSCYYLCAHFHISC